MKLIPINCSGSLSDPILENCDVGGKLVSSKAVFVNPRAIAAIEGTNGGSYIRFAANITAMFIPHPPAALNAHIESLEARNQ